MHVALSVDALSPHLSGIGRYCYELAGRLPHQLGIEGVSYFRGPRWIDDPQILLTDANDYGRSRKSWQARLDRWWRYSRFADRVVHAPNYFLPEWAVGGVATVHDLSVFKYPETHPIERIKAFEENFSSTINRAGLILTDCEWMRQEVLAFTGLPESKVRAVPLGISPEFRPRPQLEVRHALADYGLPVGQYGLCVSTLEPRKRISVLLSTWRALPRDLRDRHILVLAGGAGWCNDALMEQISAGEQEGWLRYIGYVPEAKLPYLYAGSRLFAYPSQYEGFGFPPLEAMACGIPTIVASATCLEELVGAGAVVSDPEDIQDFKELLTNMLISEDWRATLSSAGIQATSRYRWTTCIENTVRAYHAVQQDSF